MASVSDILKAVLSLLCPRSAAIPKLGENAVAYIIQASYCYFLPALILCSLHTTSKSTKDFYNLLELNSREKSYNYGVFYEATNLFLIDHTNMIRISMLFDSGRTTKCTYSLINCGQLLAHSTNSVTLSGHFGEGELSFFITFHNTLIL